VYGVAEFWLRRQPSILGALLGCEEFPNDTPLIPPTVVDFNYIAIFPLASHFEILVRHLPRIERLFVRIEPLSRHRILEGKEVIRSCDPSDIWEALDACFNYVMRELILVDNPRTNWNSLRVFENGDIPVDTATWQDAIQILENSGTKEWKEKRKGLLVRHLNDRQPIEWTDEVNGHVGGVVGVANDIYRSVYSVPCSFRWQTFITEDIIVNPFLSVHTGL
jgi:hypothetical protein